MKAGIVVDDWKLSVFRKMLTKAGYKYEDGGAMTGNTTILIVEYDDVNALGKVVKRCESEVQRQK